MDHRIGVYLRNPAPRGDGQCDKITVAFGAVAQWLERGTHNPLVVGSIPTRPTSFVHLRVLVANLAQASAAVCPTFVPRICQTVPHERFAPREACWLLGGSH